MYFCNSVKISIDEFRCLVGLVVLSATATLEVLCSIPRSSKKCYWVFLWNSQKQLGVRICARLMAIGSPAITWDLNIPANCGCTLVYLCLTLRGIQAWCYVCMLLSMFNRWCVLFGAFRGISQVKVSILDEVRFNFAVNSLASVS